VESNVNHPPVVIKVGGSLLVREALSERLASWLANHPSDSRRVLIVGGGAQVDALREQHARGDLTDDQAHWAAIDVMDANAKQLAAAMHLPLGIDLSNLPSGDSVLAPGTYFRTRSPKLPGIALPVGWQVTSDSIAARVAALLSARLVLLKSVPPPAELADDIRALADIGYVDAFFPRASLGLRELEFQTL
jgi:aspartokinase-like uncharacterized kinase